MSGEIIIGGCICLGVMFYICYSLVYICDEIKKIRKHLTNESK